MSRIRIRFTIPLLMAVAFTSPVMGQPEWKGDIPCNFVSAR